VFHSPLFICPPPHDPLPSFSLYPPPSLLLFLFLAISLFSTHALSFPLIGPYIYMPDLVCIARSRDIEQIVPIPRVPLTCTPSPRVWYTAGVDVYREAATIAPKIAKKLGDHTMVIVKGATDIVTDGVTSVACGPVQGACPRRCGGQGDVLAGPTQTSLAFVVQDLRLKCGWFDVWEGPALRANILRSDQNRKS
jgi:hypothetical protein